MNNQTFWNKRIPSVFGILILIVGVALTAWLAQQGAIFQGRAVSGNTPTQIVVTNITDRAFTVTYITTDNVLGTISYGEKGGEQTVAVDDRDQKSGEPQPHKVHSITIRNLKAKTTYAFRINSGGAVFTDNGQQFAVETGERLSDEITKNKPVTGTITTPEGKPPSEALVYLSTGDSEIISALTKSDGAYSIPTVLLRNKSLSSLIVLTPTTKLNMRIVSPQGSSDLSVLTNGSNPVPLITLSKSYDFSITSESTTPESSESAEVTGFPQLPKADETTTVRSVQIVSPKEGQALSDQRPLIKGTAPPNTEIEITINSDEPIQANTITDRRGNWSYRPKNALSPGILDVTINARDATGILKTVTQSFSVLAAGSQFTDPSVSPPVPTITPTAAPSATITPTPTKSAASPTPTPKTNTTPSPTPTGAVSTATPTIVAATATNIPSPTVVATVSPTHAVSTQPTSLTPQPSIDPTGNTDGILYALIGTIAIAVGAVLFFLTGGISL